MHNIVPVKKSQSSTTLNNVNFHLRTPRPGSYQQLCLAYWLGEFQKSSTGSSAYIAMNYVGQIQEAKQKLQCLLARHQSGLFNKEKKALHLRALSRLNASVTAKAVDYANELHQKTVLQ